MRPSGSWLVGVASSSLVVSAAGAANGIVLARVLTLGERGSVAAVLQPLAFVAVVAALGLDEVIVLQRARAGASMMAALLTGGLGAGLALLVFAADLRVALLAGATAASIAASQVLMGAVRSTRSLVAWNRLRAAHAWAVPAVFLGLTSLEVSAVPSALGALLLPNTVLSLACACLVGYAPPRVAGMTLRRLASVLAVGLGFVASRVAGGLLARGELLLLIYLGAAETSLARYSVAAAVAAPLVAVCESIGVAALKMRASKSGSAVDQRYLVSVASLVAAIGVVVIGHLLPAVFGAEYIESVPAARVLVAGIPILLLRRLYGVELRVRGAHRQALVWDLMGAALLIGAVVGVWALGERALVTYAAASVGVYVISAAAGWALLRRVR